MITDEDLNRVCNIEAIEMMRDVDRSHSEDARALRWQAHQEGDSPLMIAAAERHENIARSFRGAADRLAQQRVPLMQRRIGNAVSGPPTPHWGLSEEAFQDLLVAVRNGHVIESVTGGKQGYTVALIRYRDPHTLIERWAVDHLGVVWTLVDFSLEFDARTHYDEIARAIRIVG